MKVYVAGASKEIERAKDVIAMLRTHGIDVTSTWPDVIARVGVANPTDASISDYVKWAITDLAEVQSADVLLLLLPLVETIGAYIELGFAFAFSKVIVTAGQHRPIFTPALSTFHYATDILAVEQCYRMSLSRALVAAR